MIASLPAGTLPLAGQIAVALGSIGAITLAPPTSGTMIVIPYDGAPTAATIDASLSTGASLLGAGPLPGSIIVRGDRARLTSAFSARGVLLLAAPEAICRS